MNAAPQPDETEAPFAAVWNAFERGGMIIQCAWCKSVQIGEEWIRAPHSVFSAIDVRLSVSHSICPDCTAIAGLELAARMA